jgi:hypothetical protein
VQKVVGSIACPLVAQLADTYHCHWEAMVYGCVVSALAQVRITTLTPRPSHIPFLTVCWRWQGGIYFVGGMDSSVRYGAMMGVIVLCAIVGTYTPIADSFAMVAMGSPTKYGKATNDKRNLRLFLVLCCSPHHPSPHLYETTGAIVGRDRLWDRVTPWRTTGREQLLGVHVHRLRSPFPGDRRLLELLRLYHYALCRWCP